MTIDWDAESIEVDTHGSVRTVAFDTPEAFELVSDLWLRLGWDTKYVYGFTWMGRPVIQLPEDLVRFQEVVYRVRPDVILETGIAHGGSLVFSASLCRAMGHGCVVGVDIEVRPHNREAIEAHELYDLIDMVEGNSVSPEIVQEVRSRIPQDACVLAVLDSNHSKEHVLAELYAYAPLISVGSYIIAADGIMADVVGAPRTSQDWRWNNPREAVAEFLAGNPDFVEDPPEPEFNEGMITAAVTYWSGGWLRRVR